jgi:hypothetical protein
VHKRSKSSNMVLTVHVICLDGRVSYQLQAQMHASRKLNAIPETAVNKVKLTSDQRGGLGWSHSRAHNIGSCSGLIFRAFLIAATVH